VVLIVSVSLVEVAVRIAGIDTYFQNRFFVVNRALDYPDVFKKDSRLFWRLRPGHTVTSRFFEGKAYRINSLGLRGDEVPPKKDRPRILALGNSCTFGWGVTDEQTYTRRLEKLLGGSYEVINCGIPGYSSWQGKLFLQRELIDLQPDILLICYAWNDHWAAANQIADKDQQLPPQAILAVQNFLSRFHSYRLLKKLLLSAVEKNPDSLFDRSAPVYRVGLEDFALNLREMCRFARSHNVRPYLMTSPIASLHIYFPPGSRSLIHRYHQKYNDVIWEVAKSEGVGLIDLAAEFDRHYDLYDDARWDLKHYNAKGHLAAARLIAATLTGREPDSSSE
ncbi:MAG: SGNH/GDSL hydrolase family protein, partial [Candidatus Zixiibacteriota bacterium]